MNAESKEAHWKYLATVRARFLQPSLSNAFLTITYLAGCPHPADLSFGKKITCEDPANFEACFSQSVKIICAVTADVIFLSEQPQSLFRIAYVWILKRTLNSNGH